MNLRSIYHININCTDFERAYAFPKATLDALVERGIATPLRCCEPSGKMPRTGSLPARPSAAAV